MSKTAKLVTAEITVRVIVDDTMSESEIIDRTLIKFKIIYN